jgi:hypothetical protein
MSVAKLSATLILIVLTSAAAIAEDRDSGDRISNSVVEQGYESSPIPREKLNLAGKDRALVGLGAYLVNGAADCNGCHTFPRFLRPGGTVPGTNPVGNSTGNLANLGSDSRYGNPYLDPVPPPSGPDQSPTGQLKANSNADTTHGIVTRTPKGVPIYPYNHFLAGGRCFGFFMSRNLTPDDSGKPRGLTEAEFIQVMRQGKDISCDPNKPNPPTYGGVVDPVCSIPEGRGAGVSFNPDVLQTMSWPTYHSMTDTDLKAIYAYLSALPQSKACNTVQNGCAGFFGEAQTLGVVGQNAYAYANTDDCPKNSNNTSPPQ